MMRDKPIICICGGGNLGLVCAGVLVSKGLKVNVYSGHKIAWSRDVKCVDMFGREYSGTLNCISDEPSVVSEADIVLLCVPGFLIEKVLTDIKPFVKTDTKVGSVVSSTGFFFIAHKIFGKHKLFGFQRVPFISRVKKYGEVGQILGYKDRLKVAIENCDDDAEFAGLLSELFMCPVERLQNFYEAALTNSNPILHTGRLYSMWHDYDGTPYDGQTYFYSEWTIDASRILIAMDAEFMTLLDALNIRKGAIPTLLDYYESTDAESLTRKIRSIEAFKPILSPMKKIVLNGGVEKWIPDFSSRYFTEDFPFGLRYIKDLAEQKHISTPTIDMVYAWGIGKIDKEN